MQRSRVWQFVKVLKLTENMHVNTNVEAEKHFAKWQLDVGHGTFTNELGSMKLPDHFKCNENTIAFLVQTVYPGINQLPLPPDQYFAEHTILTSRNDDVDDINSEILKQFPGEEREFLSAASVKNDGENGNDDLLWSI